jgi:hypothetical protein
VWRVDGQGRLDTPRSVVLWNGHLLFSDTGNHAVRVIW